MQTSQGNPTRDEFKRAVASLPRQQRLVLLLSYADELSIREIAAVLHIGADHAQALLLEAVEALSVHFDHAHAQNSCH